MAFLGNAMARLAGAFPQGVGHGLTPVGGAGNQMLARAMPAMPMSPPMGGAPPIPPPAGPPAGLTPPPIGAGAMPLTPPPSPMGGAPAPMGGAPSPLGGGGDNSQLMALIKQLLASKGQGGGMGMPHPPMLGGMRPPMAGAMPPMPMGAPGAMPPGALGQI